MMMTSSKFIIFTLLLIRQITIGSTLESPPSNLSIIIQATLTNAAINTTMNSIDIETISNKMTSGFKDVQAMTIKLLEITAIPTLNADNLLNLLVVVHDTFDTIIATGRGLEHKLHGIVGRVDLAMANIQVSLQNLIQTIVVNVIITGDTRNTTQNDLNYSLLGIVDGIQLLLDTSYHILSGIVTSPGNDLAKSMVCLEGIVQTILSITENLLHSLREFLQNFKIDSSDGGYIMPKLDIALTNALNKLARNVTHSVTSLVKESLEPTLQEITVKLKRDLGSVTNSSLNLIKSINSPINDLLATIIDSRKITATRTLATIPFVIRTIPSSLLSITNGIKSLRGNAIGVQATLNVALSNTIASIHSLISYLSLITTYGFSTKIGIVVNTSKLLSDTQVVLLLLATNIQTLIDTVTQAITQSLTHQLLYSKQQSQTEWASLKESTVKISLLLENIVKVYMRVMQTLLNGVGQALIQVLPDYSKALLSAAVQIRHIVGDLGNVIEDMLAGTTGNGSKSNGRINDAIKGFKMVVDNVDNLRINLRNTFKAIESFL